MISSLPIPIQEIIFGYLDVSDLKNFSLISHSCFPLLSNLNLKKLELVQLILTVLGSESINQLNITVSFRTMTENWICINKNNNKYLLYNSNVKNLTFIKRYSKNILINKIWNLIDEDPYITIQLHHLPDMITKLEDIMRPYKTLNEYKMIGTYVKIFVFEFQTNKFFSFVLN